MILQYRSLETCVTVTKATDDGYSDHGVWDGKWEVKPNELPGVSVLFYFRPKAP